VPGEVLQVSGLKHAGDQPQNPAVADLLGQDAQQDVVIQAAETIGDVSLDEPHRPRPAA